jgi:lipopolysaccharide transport system permease protein
VSAQTPQLRSPPAHPPDADTAAAPAAAEVPLLVIEPTPGWQALNLRELWRYRELLYFLTWRDVKIRYKQTALGAAWAVLQPVMTMIVFTIFFGRLAGLNKRTGDLPYPLFVYAGLLPWAFFTNSITNAGASVVNSQNLITKIYFPRLVIPLSSVGAGFVDFAIAFGIVVGMMAWYGVAPGTGLVLFPVVLLLIALAALGIGALVSGLTVAYRDFRYVVPFVMQLWMFVTPVMYPSQMVPQEWRWVLALNPMAGLVDAFRYSLLGWPADWTPGPLFVSAGMTLAVCLVGVLYFRRVERSFADIV